MHYVCQLRRIVNVIMDDITYFLFLNTMLKMRQMIAQAIPPMFIKERAAVMGTKIVTNSSFGDPSQGIKPAQ